MHTNSVEICGVATDVRGGNTRYGSLWLLVTIEVDIDGHTTKLPVWWFGKDRKIYRGVTEGSTVKALGYLKWGKDSSDEWELRIVANVLVIEEEDKQEEKRPASRGSNARNGRNGRNGNGNGRKKADIEEEDEVPF